MRRNRSSVLGLAIFWMSLLCLAGSAQGSLQALQPLKAIGVPWKKEGPHWMSFVAFSADGRRVLSDGPGPTEDTSGYLTEWSFPDGRFVRQVAVKGTLSPDWKLYAAEGAIWEIETGKPLLKLTGATPYGYVFSPDSRQVLVQRMVKGGALQILDLKRGTEVKTFGTRTVFSAAFSPDNTILATGYWDQVMLWDVASGRRLGSLRGFGRYVRGISFSRDGKLLAAGTDAGGLQVWDVTTHKRLWMVETAGGVVSVPAFSPDGRQVAIGVYGSGALWMFEAATGRIIENRRVSDMGCGSVAFSPDGRYLITPSTGIGGRWPHDLGGTIRVFQVTR